jgi:probable phosphoglycerate mutase
MKTIYLIRHGECISNHENIFISHSQDPPLTRTGIEQVNKLTKAFKDMKVSAIFSSSSLRAKQTAAIISESLCHPFTTSESLMELDLGVLNNKDISNHGYLSMYKNMVDNWEAGYDEACISEGESLIDVNNRLISFMENNILNKSIDEPILLIGHAISWMCFIWKNCRNNPTTINGGFMEKASYSIINWDEQGFYVHLLNITPLLRVELT